MYNDVHVHAIRASGGVHVFVEGIGQAMCISCTLIKSCNYYIILAHVQLALSPHIHMQLCDANDLSSILEVSSSLSDCVEVPLQSSANVFAVSINTNTVDISTQTSDSMGCTCKCLEVLKKLDSIFECLSALQDEMALRSRDNDDTRNRCISIEMKLDKMVDYIFT